MSAAGPAAVPFDRDQQEPAARHPVAGHPWRSQRAGRSREPRPPKSFAALANADTGSHWGSNKGREQPPSGDEAVLDALDDAAEAFAALEPPPLDADAADFEFGTRVLRRIVLARRQP